MPRFARIHVAGGLFHVICRFHDRRFYLDIDGGRLKYLEYLSKAAEAHDCRIVAYCLMSSHVHLVLQLGNDPLGELTKAVNSPFGAWVNGERGGFGTVFADRPRSVLVHTETYGMELIRYVHNNPVRAGVVERAVESSWSSHQAYLGLGSCPEWLATEALYGSDVKEREGIRRELASFVDEGRREERRPEFSGEVSRGLAKRVRKLMGGDVALSYPVLGPDDFLVTVLKQQASRHRDRKMAQTTATGVEPIVNAIFEELGLEPELAYKRVKPTNVAHGRALVAWLWTERMGRPQVSVADGMNLRPTTVSKMIRRLRREGLSRNDQEMLDRVFKRLVKSNSPINTGRAPKSGKVSRNAIKEPRILVLKRKR